MIPPVLEKNETVTVPKLPTPRAPSKVETERAVKITVLANSTSVSEYNIILMLACH